MTEPMQPGSVGRLTKDVPGEMRKFYRGTLFTVEDYVSEEQSEDGEAFYWGSVGDGMGNLTVSVANCERHLSAEEAATRRIPTLAEATEWLGTTTGDIADMGVVDETFWDVTDGTVEFCGTTEDGLPFAIHAKITGVYPNEY